MTLPKPPLLQLPIPSRSEWPLTSSKPYGSPIFAAGFDTQQGFNDISGYGNHLIPAGGIKVTKKGGFRGYDGVQTATATGIQAHVANTPFSVCFWHKQEDANGSNLMLWGASVSAGIAVYAYNSGYVFVYGTGSGGPITAYPYIPGEWTFGCFTYDGDKWRAYRNGILSATSAAGQLCNGLTTVSTLRIGSTSIGLASLYGEERCLQMYNSLLTQDDITAIYQQGYPTDSPVAAYGFNTGRNFEDVSGNGNNGTNVASIVRAKGGYIHNGSSYVSTTKSIVHTTAWSMSKWVRSAWTGTQTLFGCSAINGIQVRSSTNNIQLIDGNSGSGGIISTSSPLIANKYQLVTLVWDAPNNMAYLYVDLTLVASGNPNVSTFATANFWFGASYNGQGMTGYDREIKVWNKAITLAEITKFYRENIPTNRQNELFSTIDGQDDRSTYGSQITRVSPAISVDGAMRFDGTTGRFDIPDKTGTGDATYYFTLYLKTFGGSGAGRIFETTTYRLFALANNLRFSYIAGGGVEINTPANSISLLIPYRIAFTWKAATGLIQFYKNGLPLGTEQSGNIKAAASTTINIGNNAAGNRGWDGEISLVRINAGIDTLAQIQKDNQDFGY